VQSFSPALAIETDLLFPNSRKSIFNPNEKLKKQYINDKIPIGNSQTLFPNSLIEFADEVIEENYHFTVKIKSTISLNDTVENIEVNIGNFIQAEQEKHGKHTFFNPKKASHVLSIDIRGHTAFLYLKNIMTFWGGRPIESDKAMLTEWIGQSLEPLAAQMMLRRGAVVLPLIFDFGEYKIKDMDKKIKINTLNLAKYYSDKLTIISLAFYQVLEHLEQQYSEIANAPCVYCLFARLKLIDGLLSYRGKSEPYRYLKKPLYLRSVIFSSPQIPTLLWHFIQEFRFVSLFPCFDLPSSCLEPLTALIKHPFHPFEEKDDRFSEKEMLNFSSILLPTINTATENISQKNQAKTQKLKDIFDDPLESCCALKDNCIFLQNILQKSAQTLQDNKDQNGLIPSKNNIPPVEKLVKFFESPAFITIFEKIVSQQQIQQVTACFQENIPNREKKFQK
jgi:hypothetical protein